jgi:hypothetical protein
MEMVEAEAEGFSQKEDKQVQKERLFLQEKKMDVISPIDV